MGVVVNDQTPDVNLAGANNPLGRASDLRRTQLSFRAIWMLLDGQPSWQQRGRQQPIDAPRRPEGSARGLEHEREDRGGLAPCAGGPSDPWPEGAGASDRRRQQGPGGGAGPPMTNANDVLSGRLFATDFLKISISCSFPISLTREGRPKGFHIVFSFRLSLSPEKGRLVLAEMLSHNSLKILRLGF